MPASIKPPDHALRLHHLTGIGHGWMKLAGQRIPGRPSISFFDDNPFSKLIADADGKWSIEGDMKLEPGNHTFRAEQYEESGMISDSSR